MKRKESLEVKRRRPSGVGVLGIVGGAVVVLAAVVVFTSFNDIRRYVRMVRM